MYSDFNFAERLASLREQRGVSARDMSLSLGQNPSYINKLENGKAMPSMEVFFYICDYLHVSPAEFFDEKKKAPAKLREISKECQGLSGESLEHLLFIIRAMSRPHF